MDSQRLRRLVRSILRRLVQDDIDLDKAVEEISRLITDKETQCRRDFANEVQAAALRLRLGD